MYVLAFAIFNSVRGEPLAAAATNLEEVDEKDESNDFGMQVYIYYATFMFFNIEMRRI